MFFNTGFEYFIFILFIITYAFIVFKYAPKGRYQYDIKRRIIYYPNSSNKGYIINDKTIIDKINKSLYKCFLFNFKGYNDDVKKILEDSEVVNEPLPPKVCFENVAKAYPVWALFVLLLCDICIIGYFYTKHVYFVAIAMLPLLIIQSKQIIIKLQSIKEEHN